MDGTVIKDLRGHRDKIYSVSFSFDGRRIASGGADKNTIIWNDEGKGILKFTHTDSVQVVAYNPVEDVLASCSSSDFGFWSQDDKNILKHKVDSKILCASWRNDGHMLAIGFFSGNVSFYNINGIEIGHIERNAPVWSIAWASFSGEQDGHCISIGTWDMVMSLYDEFGEQLCEDKYLGYYPCGLVFLGLTSNYIIVGGSSGGLKIFSKDGIFLQDYSEDDSWIWSVDSKLEQQIFVTINSSGIISLYKCSDYENITYDSWGEIVAVREKCVDVKIYDTANHHTQRIKFDASVNQIALFDHQIAVHVNNELILYECTNYNEDFLFKCQVANLCEKVNLMRITANFIIVTFAQTVRVYYNTGELVNEWDAHTNITSILLLRTDPEEANVLVGCEDGKVLALSLKSVFHDTLLDVEQKIKSMKVSCGNQYLGLICEQSQLYVFDLVARVYVKSIKGSEFIFFHDQLEYLFCHGDDDLVNIEDLHGKSIVHYYSGEILNFRGSNILCLKTNYSLHHTRINLMTLAYQRVEKYDFDAALEIANLGSCNKFLNYLARQALINLNFSVAVQCYRQLNMVYMLDYIRAIKLKIPQYCNMVDQIKAIISVETALMENGFEEAENIVKDSNCDDELLEILIKMRKFNNVRNLLSSNDKRLYYITSKEAEWQETLQNWERSSALYFDIKKFQKAVDIVGKTKGEGWIKYLCNLAGKIPSDEVGALKKCAMYLSGQDGLDNTITNIFTKIKDYSSLMTLFMRNNQWIEVGQLCDNHLDKIDEDIILEYANWLASQGTWDGAIVIFRKIARHDMSISLIGTLIEKATLEQNFNDVSWFYTMLSSEIALLVCNLAFSMNDNHKLPRLHSILIFHLQKGDSRSEAETLFPESDKLSDIYYAYNFISNYIDPLNALTWSQPSSQTIVNICSFLLNSLASDSIPNKISILTVLIELAKHSTKLGAFKTARRTYKEIRDSFLLPTKLHRDIRLNSMIIQVRSHFHFEDCCNLKTLN